MSELRPCPYCGERGEIQETYWPDERKSEWYAWCPGECLTVKPCETQEEAADMWNEAVDAINAYRRTCTVEDDRIYPYIQLSCGHVVSWKDAEYPAYCSYCGARVVSE